MAISKISGYGQPEPRINKASAAKMQEKPAVKSSSQASDSQQSVKAGGNLAGPERDTVSLSANALGMGTTDSKAPDMTPFKIDDAQKAEAGSSCAGKDKAGNAPSEGAAAKQAEEAGHVHAEEAGDAGNSGNVEASGKTAQAAVAAEAPAEAAGLLQQLIQLLRSMGMNDIANQLEQMAGQSGGASSIGAPQGAASGGGAGAPQGVGGLGDIGSLLSQVMAGGGGVAAGDGHNHDHSVSGGGLPPATGPVGPISRARLEQAAGGNQKIVATLEKVAQHPDGARALQAALDKGATFQAGNLAGSVVGLTESGGGGGPRITLEDPSNIDIAAHEIAHAAYPNMAHNEVYAFGHRVARGLGAPISKGPANLDNLVA